jgi:hypothetical protein
MGVKYIISTNGISTISNSSQGQIKLFCDDKEIARYAHRLHHNKWQGLSDCPQMDKALLLSLVFVLIGCSSKENREKLAPIPSNAVVNPVGGTPVAGAPVPEIVQLKKIEEIGETKQVTVGNFAGDYLLACSLAANTDHPVKSCLSPSPRVDYLLFRENTKWLISGGKEPMSLSFMENWSVSYNNAENVGLISANHANGEAFGVYRLLSWTAARPVSNQP